MLEKTRELEDFAQFAGECTFALFGDEFAYEEAMQLCQSAFSFAPRVAPLNDAISLLELFHGPSCAFKDFGAAYLAALMEQRALCMSKPITVLTATSGDTGSAVAQAFFKKEKVHVVILYPSGRVSPLQEKQLTTLGHNVHALEVRGSFDDCQRMVKEAFADAALREGLLLTSANSINIGRLIPQSFYYLFAWQQLRRMYGEDATPLFCVPSGNFGNLTAGLLAWRWGMGVSHFVAATNANATVPHYLHSGVYEPQASVKTLANAMDVGAPSNFERMQTMFALLAQPMHSVLYGAQADDAEIAQTMRNVHEQHGVYVCPHTAAGIHGAQAVLGQAGCAYKRAVVLATAHAGKFAEVVRPICGSAPPMPPRLAVFLKKEKRATSIEASSTALAQALQAL